MKTLVILLCIGVLAYAKPSYPIHPGVGAIYKGPNAETIIEGPDGSIITSEAAGGAVGIDGHQAVAEAAVASAIAATKSAAVHQVVDQSAVAASASAVSHSTLLSKTPIVVQQPIVVAEPVLVAERRDTAALDGPSGSILRHGENAVISGPASTTIRDGKVVTSIPKAILAEPSRTLVAPSPVVVDAALAAAPIVGISHGATLANVAEANAHLADINFINEANIAAQISEANRAALAKSEVLTADINAANAAALTHGLNIQTALTEADKAALVGAKAHFAHAVAPQISIADVNAINSANLVHSQQALARANLEAQLAHAVTPQVTVAGVDAINSAVLAHSQEALAKANLVATQISVASINAINSANLAHSQEALSRANLEAQLAAERNAIAAHITYQNGIAFRPELNPVITQGNQIISDAVIAGTPAPVVEVTPVSTIAPVVSTTIKPIIVPARAKTIFSSTLAPTPGYFVKTPPSHNVIVSSTLKPVSSTLTNIAAVPLVSHPEAVVTPVKALGTGQVVYQSSSSSTSEAVSHSSSSSRSSSTNIINGGLGGVANVVGGPVVGAPISISSSDLAQWQNSFAKSGHIAGGSILAFNAHRGVIH